MDVDPAADLVDSGLQLAARPAVGAGAGISWIVGVCRGPGPGEGIVAAFEEHDGCAALAPGARLQNANDGAKWTLG